MVCEIALQKQLEHLLQKSRIKIVNKKHQK